MKRGGPLERRTPLARTQMTKNPPKARQAAPRARVRPVSAKRAKANTIRASLVAQLLAAEPVCQARWACSGAPARDVHERLKRSRGGSITDAAHGHMVTVCRPCHELTESHPAEATRRRMLLPSWHQCPPVGPC